MACPDPLLSGSKIEAHAAHVAVKVWMWAQFAPWFIAEHALIEKLLLLENRRDDEIGVEMFPRQPRRTLSDVGHLWESLRVFEPHGELRCVDDGGAFLKVGLNTVGKDVSRREPIVRLGWRTDPQRTGQLAIDECRRHPRVGRMIERFVETMFGARVDAPTADQLTSNPINSLNLRARAGASVLDPVEESQNPIRT